MKTFFKTIAYGAAIYTGYFVAREGLNKLRDPYERAKMKNKFKKVKNTIFEKTES